MWCAAITSVVGAAYTSVSFIKTFHPWLTKNERWVISFFIIFSTIVFLAIGNPVKILVAVGALNGFILPVALAVMLIATVHKKTIGAYQHPWALQCIGWMVVIVMSWMGYLTITNWLTK